MSRKRGIGSKLDCKHAKCNACGRIYHKDARKHSCSVMRKREAIRKRKEKDKKIIDQLIKDTKELKEQNEQLRAQLNKLTSKLD